MTDNRPILMDVTRVLRRMGHRHTGIDRVEQAWLTYLANHNSPAMGFMRSHYGYGLIPKSGLARLSRSQHTKPTIWRPMLMLPNLLKYVPADSIYLNVGHSNLTQRVVTALRNSAMGPLAVMVHDAIPLDYPHLQRPGTNNRFRSFLRQAERVDHIICPSKYSSDRVSRHMKHHSVTIAPLGLTEFPPPQKLVLPEKIFVFIGTVEPRKNIGLLLSVWQQNAHRPDWPSLLICGAPGWESPALLKSLGQTPPEKVIWLPNANDAQLAYALDHAQGLLFPSLVEGYGFPPREALARGCPVIASNLSVLKQDLKKSVIYVDPHNAKDWTDAILSCPPRHTPILVPQWSEHFKTVLNSIC